HSGYQTVSRERATGSFSKVDNDLINRSTSTGILARLQSLVPGMLFDKNSGNNTGINIRGISSIFASSRPLIVVDNFPYDGDLQNINPNDVESYFYRSSLRQQHAVSLEGGSATNNYFLSFGADKDESTLVGNEFNRFTVLAKNVFRPTPKLQVQVSVNFIQSKGRNNNNGG